jgi:hypothetical protein
VLARLSSVGRLALLAAALLLAGCWLVGQKASAAAPPTCCASPVMFVGCKALVLVPALALVLRELP